VTQRDRAEARLAKVVEIVERAMAHISHSRCTHCVILAAATRGRMSEPKTLEEIERKALRLAALPSPERAPSIAAALREAVAARDAEWSDALWPVNPEGAEAATPEEAKAHINAVIAYAVADERKAIREIDARIAAWDLDADLLTKLDGERPRDAAQIGYTVACFRWGAALDARESAEPGRDCWPPNHPDCCEPGAGPNDDSYLPQPGKGDPNEAADQPGYFEGPPALPLGHPFFDNGKGVCWSGIKSGSYIPCGQPESAHKPREGKEGA